MNSRAVGIVILNMVFSLVEDDDVAAEADRAVLGLRSHARGMARVGSRGNEPLIRYLGPIRPLKVDHSPFSPAFSAFAQSSQKSVAVAAVSPAG